MYLPVFVGFSYLSNKILFWSSRIMVTSKKLILLLMPISNVNCNLSWNKLKVSNILFNWSKGAANKISSTYLQYKGSLKGSLSIAFVSRSRKTKSAIMGDKGEPIGVPKICLKTILFKRKNVDSNTNFVALIKIFFGMAVLRSINFKLVKELNGKILYSAPLHL